SAICTNSNICTVDATPPTFDSCSNSSTNLGCNPGSVPSCNDPLPTASDNCGPAVVTCASSETTNGCAYARTLVYTATDGCLNTAICTKNYTWTVDTTPPSITCPSDVSVTIPDVMTCVCDVTLSSPVVSDNCGATTVTNIATSCFNTGMNLLIW